LFGNPELFSKKKKFGEFVLIRQLFEQFLAEEDPAHRQRKDLLLWVPIKTFKFRFW